MRPYWKRPSSRVYQVVVARLSSGGFEHEDLGCHVGVEVDLGHERDHLAAGYLLDRLRERAAHRHLELLSGRLDRFLSAGVDERSFGGGVDVFEVDGQVVALIDDAGCAGSPSVAVVMKA